MIVQKYPHLMAPFSVKGVHFKNHIFLAPCALSHVTYGAPNDLGIEYIEEKARGGVAQITQGNITAPCSLIAVASSVKAISVKQFVK